MDWRKIAENRNQFWLNEKKQREQLEAQLAECQQRLEERHEEREHLLNVIQAVKKQRDGAMEALKDAYKFVGRAPSFASPLIDDAIELRKKMREVLSLCDE